MIDLSALAGELDALVRDGRRIRLGDRNFEKPHAELDELLGRLQRVASDVRIGSLTVNSAVIVQDHRKEGAVRLMPASPITGRGQYIVCHTRGPRR
ncbi:protein of unknown function [Methylorubrum extorquens]|uniref:Uncharacterized protein n=1 Tax=Methylorubrum extorquens TaxID=408 RepID=A0A2N9ARA7_METEX|nr:protein of unknown function [Methylorubrum extorquens]